MDLQAEDSNCGGNDSGSDSDSSSYGNSKKARKHESKEVKKMDSSQLISSRFSNKFRNKQKLPVRPSSRKPPAPKGIKQCHLCPELDLLHTKMIPRQEGILDSTPLHKTGTQVVLVLGAYRDFISSLPVGFISTDEMEEIQTVCSSAEVALYGTITASTDAVVNEEHEAIQYAGILKIITLTPLKHSEEYKILSVSMASSLLQTDTYLLLKEKYNTSLRSPFLHVGAQVRRLFSNGSTREHDDENSRQPCVSGVWYEGNIYYIRKDIKTNPYNAVTVVWLIQEKDTNDWLYAYTQTDSECSPWDLEISHFVLAENMRPPIYAKALRVGKLTAEPILNHLKSLDFTYPFQMDVSDIKEYVDMFPDEKDQIDLLKISKLCSKGRYEGARDVGILTLFDDLQRMVNNGKYFNQCNMSFQPWRLADMLDKELLALRELLATYHSDMHMLLEKVDIAREEEVANSQEEIEAL